MNFYFASLSRDDAGILLGNAWELLVGRRSPSERDWSGRTERAITEAMGSVAAYAFPSARSGLWLTLRALGIGPGDEVLVVGFTCVAVPAPVVYVGAAPVYMDILPRTFNVDVAGIERHITPRTRALVVQHTFGNPADSDRIAEMARRHRLYVIEDCCLATGSRDAGGPVGRHGDVGFASFELSKTVTGGWGGLVWVNNPAIDVEMRRVTASCGPLSRGEAARRSFQVGASFFLYHPEVHPIGRYVSAALYRLGVFRRSTSPREAAGEMPRGYTDRLSDAHWRVILGKLERLEAIRDRRARLAAVYRAVLAEAGVDTSPVVEDGAEPCWVRFPFLVADRRRMQRHFRKRGIEVGQWFDNPVSGATDPGRFGYEAGACPNGEFAARHVVNLPVDERVSDADARGVAHALAAYVREDGENQAFARAVAGAAAAEPARPSWRAGDRRRP